MKKILCAMSGGVDSAVAALKLKSDGFDIVGATMLLSGNASDAEDALNICKKIGIEHITLDFKKEFDELVKKEFCVSYINGETPNPCVTCNKKIKFGLFLDYALNNGFDGIATGHYVRKANLGGHTLVKCAADKKKDQSYMLWQLSEEQIIRSVFPLGEMTKPEIREIAASNGFINAYRKDSQDICFIPDGNYASFIEKSTRDINIVPGDYLDKNGNIIGRHKGCIHYTIGQRKGLGVAFGEPMYVLSKDAESNTVTLGRNEELFTKEITLRSSNISPAVSYGEKYCVKIRYAHVPAPAAVYDMGDGCLKIIFDTPQRAPAKGQSAVIYKDELLLGGGIIL